VRHWGSMRSVVSDFITGIAWEQLPPAVQRKARLIFPMFDTRHNLIILYTSFTIGLVVWIVCG